MMVCDERILRDVQAATASRSIDPAARRRYIGAYANWAFEMPIPPIPFEFNFTEDQNFAFQVAILQKWKANSGLQAAIQST
jgi:hypothetical protein